MKPDINLWATTCIYKTVTRQHLELEGETRQQWKSATFALLHTLIIYVTSEPALQINSATFSQEYQVENCVSEKVIK